MVNYCEYLETRAYKETSDLIGDSLDTIQKSLAPYWSDFLVY